MRPPQRDEAAALRARLEAIDAELDDVRQRARRLGALERERGRIEAERAEIASRLAAFGGPSALAGLRVASPCPADWAAMQGDDQVRYCGKCQKNVYNLSGMRRAEAEALIARYEGGELCVRMFQRADGTVLTADCPEGARRKRRLALFGAAAAGVAVAGAAATSLWSAPAPPLEPSAPAVMGTVAAPSPPPPADLRPTFDLPPGPATDQ
ncbi:MAG TPA: hypothetical protein VFS00_00775, partial [Polyangiaceae bacterium]|nr:hypothetical protein [Polyangiaceae bacterium]